MIEGRILPPGIDFGATDEPVKARAWRNMIFSKDGSSHLCNPVYHTEQAAKKYADATLADIRSLPGDEYLRHHDGAWGTVSSISHCLQVPWKWS